MAFHRCWPVSVVAEISAFLSSFLRKISQSTEVLSFFSTLMICGQRGTSEAVSSHPNRPRNRLTFAAEAPSEFSFSYVTPHCSPRLDKRSAPPTSDSEGQPVLGSGNDRESFQFNSEALNDRLTISRNYMICSCVIRFQASEFAGLFGC